MGIAKLIKDLTTLKDNETHDVGRTFIVVVMIMTPIVTVWGCGLETWHCIVIPDHSFDLQAFFQAVSTLWLGIGAFMLSSAYSLKVKQTTDVAIGSTTTVNKQESTTTIKETTP